MAQSLNVSSGNVVLVVTAYQTALVMGLLPVAALGEAIGPRRAYAGGVALFTLASLGCAAAPNLAWLVAARFAQGVGGAAIMSLGVGLMRHAIPPDRFGRILGLNTLTVALSSAIGPTLGAAILSVAHWPWLFGVNVPIGLIAGVAAFAIPPREGTGHRLDIVSIALNVLAFGAFVVGAEALAVDRWRAGALIAVAILAIILLFRRERAKPAPLIPIDLLRLPAFRTAVLASIACFIGQSAGLIALPFYLQHGLGLSALEAGFYLTPWPLGVAVTAPFAGRLADRMAAAKLCAIGGVVMGSALAVLCLVPVGQCTALIGAMTALTGVGFGLFNVANNRTMYLGAPPERSSAAGGMQGTARLTGQTTGAIAMTLLFELVPGNAAPMMGLATAAILMFVAAMISAMRLSGRHASSASAAS
jgi:DHA2 family multidrug resistance protein-like MFS transporter